MKLALFLACIALPALAYAQQIKWMPGNWALNCDFPGGDFKHVRTSGERCGGTCADTNGCTHFTHTSHSGGTCWMKQGGGNKAKAVYKQGAVCGIIIEGEGPDPGPDPGPGPSPGGGTLGCDFLFGRAFKGPNEQYSHVDYISVWAGYDEWFNPHHHGAMLETAKKNGKFGLFYAYFIAFMARRDWGLQDCNVPGTNLCEKGAAYIRAKRGDIIAKYRHYAHEAAKIIGRDTMMVWLIEPDYHQYFKDSYNDKKQEGGPLGGPFMRALFDDLANAIKSELPNAKISWDISAWIGEGGMREWWGYFASSNQIDFVHTSGGESQAWSDQIRPNELRWQQVHQITGKKIIADTGYGVGGGDTGHNEAYDSPDNLRNRIRDGVIAVTQASPKHDWGGTLNWLRPQLPKLC